MKLDPPDIDPRIRRTRQMLFQAFMELLGEKSFEGISVQDIAERSTVNRATFYDHFTDKFHLLEEMIDERFRAMFAARMAGADGTCQEGLKRLVLAVCDFFDKLSCGFAKHQRQFEPTVETKIRAVVREFLIEGLQHCGGNVPEVELRATVASWSICGAALEWSRAKTTSPEAFAEALLPLVQPALQV